jgi:signal transduction histidine kinase/pSer/pThr/pTyr-binding forkhead associated (FHA) protein
MTVLYIIEGPNKGDSFALKKGVLYLGRASQNDIQIKDRSISGKHLRITTEDGGFFVEDLQSTNGTYIDGEMIHPGEKVRVEERHPIALGNTLMCLDREFTVGDSLITHSIRYPFRLTKKKESLPLKHRQVTTPRNLELIYKVSNVLMQSFDINEILEKIMDYLFDCLKRIDRCAILLLDNRTGELSEIIARSRKGGKKAEIDYSRTVVNRVIDEGKPVIMSDTDTAGEIDLSDSIRALKIRSVLCVPLISRSEMRGVIYVDSLNIPAGFTKEDLYLLIGLSSPAAIAIENALLYANLEQMIESRSNTLKETEKQLRKSEARFRAIFDNMQSGVVVYEDGEEDGGFIISNLNHAATRIEKLKKKDVVGRPVLDVFPGYLMIGLMEILQDVRENGRPRQLPACHYEDERLSGWRDYYVCRLPSGEIVTIYNDITEKKQSEDEQKALQEKLAGAQKLESIGRLAGGVAHNFRNILQAILGNVEYLEMIYREDPEVSEMAKNINNSVNKGVDLVNSLLHFSKRGEDLELSVLDLGEVIRDTYRITDRLFDKRIELRLQLQESALITGNQSLLSLAFMNLFSNARDAMPNGGKLLIQTRKMDNQAIAVVSDTGHGMDKKTLEKIFDPFFTAKEVGKGTGLGLSTVHGIMEQHRGSITVSSHPGKGTTFTLYFPLAKQENLQSEEAGERIVYGNGQTVLLVSNDDNTADSLIGLIRGLGYKAVHTRLAEGVLEYYMKWHPAAVLLDPDASQTKATRCARDIVNEDPRAKIIMTTNDEQFVRDEKGGLAKKTICGYIKKPWKLQEISKILGDVLDKI